jgi:alpha-N-arabinofuranosidase
MTESGGPAWRQTIFWPFAQFSNLGRGRVLLAQVDSPSSPARYYDPRGSQDLFFALPETPYLKLAAVHDEQARTLTLFALNRSLGEEMPLRVSAEGFAAIELEHATQLHDADLSAVNSRTDPDRVKLSTLAGVHTHGNSLSATLRPASWNVIRVRC